MKNIISYILFKILNFLRRPVIVDAITRLNRPISRKFLLLLDPNFSRKRFNFLLSDKYIVVGLDNGCELEINLNDHLGFKFYLTKVIEPQIGSIMKRYGINSNSKVLDVGANIGLVSLPLKKEVGFALVCIEANPNTYGNLRRNLLLNRFDDVVSFNLALGDAKRSVNIHTRPGNSGASSLFSEWSAGLCENEIYKVEMICADDLSVQDFDFVKVDIEGSEISFLRGASKILASKAIIYCEYVPFEMRKIGTDVGELVGLLSSNDRTVVFIDEFGRQCNDIPLDRRGSLLSTRSEDLELF